MVNLAALAVIAAVCKVCVIQRYRERLSLVENKQDKLRKRQYSPHFTVRESKQIESEVVKSVLH